MRGENLTEEFNAESNSGSSPHARGKLMLLFVRFRSLGLIPACAGKTEFNRVFAIAHKAHPRMRGENCGLVLAASWGGGLIPACAGKTVGVRVFSIGQWAHPRMRGENLVWCSSTCAAGGSSPHARGKRSENGPGAQRRRLIPACAGKTDQAYAPLLVTRAHPRMRGENTNRISYIG